MKHITVLLALAFVVVACEPEQPVQKKTADDGCVGYRIKPDGSKECMRR